MRLYGILENDKNGREARKGSDKMLTVKLTRKGIPEYLIEYSEGENGGLRIQDMGNGLTIFREFNKSKTQTGI